MNQNSYSFMLATGASLCLFTAIHSYYSVLVRFLVFCVGVWFTAGALSTGTRSVWIVILGFALLFLSKCLRTRRHIGMLICTMVVAFGISSTFDLRYQIEEFLYTTIWRTGGRDESDEQRLEIAHESLEGIISAGLFGQGYKKTEDAYVRFYIMEHSDILFYMNAYGMFFLVPFVYLISITTMPVVRERQWDTLILLICFFIPYSASTPFINFLYSPMWILVALLNCGGRSVFARNSRKISVSRPLL